jgi:hypothetical protein
MERVDERRAPPASSTPPIAPDRGFAVALLATLALTAYGGYLRAVDLGPPALHLDDLWVAVLSRAPTWREFLANGSSSPPLFNLLVRASIAIGGSSELSAQLVPYAASLGAIVATALVTYLITRSATAMVAAAALVAFDPLAIVLAARVKQYSTDMLVSVGHLAGCWALLTRYRRRSLYLYATFSCVGFLLSTVSVFLLASFGAAAFLGAFRKNRDIVIVVTAGVVVVVLGASAAVFLPGSMSRSLISFWDCKYLCSPFVDVVGFGRGIVRIAASWLAEPLHGMVVADMPDRALDAPLTDVPAVLVVGLALVVAGGARLGRSGLRPLVAAHVVLALLLIGASLARRMPLSTGRVELFLLPLVATLAAAALGGIEEIQARRWRATARLCLLGAALPLVPLTRIPQYPLQDSAVLVRAIERERMPGEVLWVSWTGSFALSYYGKWDVDFVPDPRIANGFYPRPRAADVRVLVTSRDLDLDPAHAPRRIFLLAAAENPALLPLLDSYLKGRGYELERRDARSFATLVVYRSQ